MSAIVLLPDGLLRLLIAVLSATIIVVLIVLLFVFRRTKNDLASAIAACKRERLQDNVEAVTVLVGECGADRQPVVVLAFALYHGEGAIRRLLCLCHRQCSVS
jgi:hypothetical protein